MEETEKKELAARLAPVIEPILADIASLWKDASVSLVVLANDLPDGNLLITTESDPTVIIDIIKRRIEAGCTLERTYDPGIDPRFAI